MRLIDKLEKIQKGSQSFDDSRIIFQRCFDKCSLNELIKLKTKLFDEKLNLFEDLFHIESINDEQQQHKIDLIQFLSTPIQDFQQIIKLHFGQLIKPQLKQQISSPINNHYQVLLLLFTKVNTYINKSIFREDHYYQQPMVIQFHLHQVSVVLV
jgi:hypothetical protein